MPTRNDHTQACLSITPEQAVADQLYMRRCLQLARLGEEWVAPNPMVGAVIVCDGRIIGEGWHRRYGDWHAEPNAIASVKDASLLSRSTMYVSLEPCAHFGKTPPCAHLLASKQLKRVVVGMLDPNPLVAGRGIAILREAGIAVTTGVMEEACRELNKRFLCLHEQHRPYVTLKWAQTADGFMDRRRTSPTEPVTVISNTLTKHLVHQMRAHNMAILVGTRTALLDNPRLMTTRWCGRNPMRIVIDRQLTLPANTRLLNGDAPTIVFSALDAYPFDTPAEVVRLNFNDNIWPQIMHHLAQRNIHSLIVEGGAKTLKSLLSIGLFDEIHVEVSTAHLHDGVPAPDVDTTHAASCTYNGNHFYLIRNTH